MTTLTWLTDIHLNFLDYDERTVFYQQIIKASGDAVVITGDICEAQSVAEVLMEMAQAVQKPIYFVLGNHDYYHGSVSQVRIPLSPNSRARIGSTKGYTFHHLM